MAQGTITHRCSSFTRQNQELVFPAGLLSPDDIRAFCAWAMDICTEITVPITTVHKEEISLNMLDCSQSSVYLSEFTGSHVKIQIELASRKMTRDEEDRLEISMVQEAFLSQTREMLSRCHAYLYHRRLLPPVQSSPVMAPSPVSSSHSSPPRTVPTPPLSATSE
jgi:hypothetical protein